MSAGTPSPESAHHHANLFLETEPGYVRKDEHCMIGGSTRAHLVLGATAFVEIFTATFNLLFLIAHGTTWPFIEFVVSAYPRLLCLFICSYVTYPPRWWTQWLKVDINFIAWVRSSFCLLFSLSTILHLLIVPLLTLSLVALHASSNVPQSAYCLHCVCILYGG